MLILKTCTAKLRLPFTELTEEVCAVKARNLVITVILKTDSPIEVEEAKSRLRMKEITGIANLGNEGLGWRKRQYYSSSNKKAKRDMVVKVVRVKEEHRQRIPKTPESRLRFKSV